MTFPSGGPGTGGFPGQGPQQPQQQFPGPPAPSPGGGGLKLGLPQILFLSTAVLGVVNLFLGFAYAEVAGDVPQGYAGPDGMSFYGNFGGAWLPMMFFLSGLAAALTILPGEHKPGPWPAILAVAVLFPFLFVTFVSEGSFGAGAIMILIFGIIQTLAAVAAYLFEENIIKPPQPKPAGQPGPYGQQGPGAGGFGQQPPQGPQAGQPGQPQSGGFAQQGPPQPVNPHQQPTAYAPQQGQFFQPQESGQQGQSGQPGQSGQLGQQGQPGQQNQQGQSGQQGS